MDIKKLANEVLDSSVESSKENKSWNDYVGEFSDNISKSCKEDKLF
ncbi:MAG: hypothetical protein GX180_02175 [Enterococcus sp.]|jgi:hypothetical protein|nr:hypothetical protein [Enterococcus sp.]